MQCLIVRALCLVSLIGPSALAANPVDVSTNHLFPAKLDGSGWGFINRHGRFIVEPKYFHVLPSRGGCVTAFEIDGEITVTSVFDHSGRLLITTKDKLVVQDGGRFVLTDGEGRVRVADKSGRIIIPPGFDAISPFESDGLISARKGEREGFITPEGKVVIPFEYANAGEFSEGRAWVLQDRNDHRSGTFITTENEKLPTPPFYFGKRFSEGLAVVFRDWDETTGFVDRSGKLVIPFIFRRAGDFHEGMAWAENPGGKTGFIHASGEWAIPPRFDGAGDFNDGLAPVLLKGSWSYIDREGRSAITLENARRAHPFEHGLALVEWGDGTSGYMDHAGKIVWRSNNKRLQ